MWLIALAVAFWVIAGYAFAIEERKTSALIFAAIWLIVACLSRYSSLAALSASALTPAALWLMKMPSAAALFLVLSVITWIMHRANIRRLLDGSEGKIGARSA
jgi:glycerol-3-phosphate acyltransferase PlsY